MFEENTVLKIDESLNNKRKRPSWEVDEPTEMSSEVLARKILSQIHLQSLKIKIKKK